MDSGQGNEAIKSGWPSRDAPVTGIRYVTSFFLDFEDSCAEHTLFSSLPLPWNIPWSSYLQGVFLRTALCSREPIGQAAGGNQARGRIGLFLCLVLVFSIT